jgi:hypothetical protein
MIQRGVVMGTLNREIEVFNDMQPELESDFMGKWVVFHDRKLVGAYDTFALAVTDAYEKRKIRPCLIRKVGQKGVPASVRFACLHA